MRKACLPVLALAASLTQAQVVHTFDVDAQGWTRGDWVESSGVFQNFGALTWLNSDGFPAPCIQFTDPTSDWYVFLAPASFTGNQNAAAGKELSFDYRLQSNSGLLALPWVAAIEASGTKFFYPNRSTGMNLWQKLRVPLVGSYGWRKDSPSGPAASDAEFSASLANVTRLAIMGDWRSNTGDITKIDNVAIGNSASVVVESTFTGGADNWVEVDVSLEDPTKTIGGRTLATYSGTTGNPPGSLQYTDVTNSLSMFEATQSMTGNLSSFAGGSLRWDLQTTGSGIVFVDNYAHAVLTGGGMHLIYLAPELNAYLPTTFQDFSIPLSPNSGWRKNTPNGPIPTFADFQKVLGHVERTMIKAEYRSGSELNRIDNVRFEQPVFTNVTGKVSLGSDYVGVVSGMPVTISVYRGVCPMEEVTTVLSAQGIYSAQISTSGPVTLRIKASHWLRRASSSFVANGGAVSGVDVTLINGDCDGDNTIGTDDYLLLNGAFDTVLGDANFDARADLNGDETVGTDDYLILNAVFDTAGD